MSGKTQVHVAVGVITNASGEILIAKRADHLHQGGLWEFPGGKVEVTESVRQALTRELKEELDIDAQVFSPLIEIRHDYADKSVFLDVWHITEFYGEPKGLEGQPLQWVSVTNLNKYQFPQANQSIITALHMPREMMITGEWKDLSDFDYRFNRALCNGIRCVQLRAHQCTASDYIDLFQRAKQLCTDHGAVLLANTSVEIFNNLKCEGGRRRFSPSFLFLASPLA